MSFPSIMTLSGVFETTTIFFTPIRCFWFLLASIAFEICHGFQKSAQGIVKYLALGGAIIIYIS